MVEIFPMLKMVPNLPKKGILANLTCTEVRYQLVVHAGSVQPLLDDVFHVFPGAGKGLEVEPEEVGGVDEAAVVKVVHVAS